MCGRCLFEPCPYVSIAALYYSCVVVLLLRFFIDMYICTAPSTQHCNGMTVQTSDQLAALQRCTVIDGTVSFLDQCSENGCTVIPPLSGALTFPKLTHLRG